MKAKTLFWVLVTGIEGTIITSIGLFLNKSTTVLWILYQVFLWLIAIPTIVYLMEKEDNAKSRSEVQNRKG